jgi:hypothetical protein
MGEVHLYWARPHASELGEDGASEIKAYRGWGVRDQSLERVERMERPSVTPLMADASTLPETSGFQGYLARKKQYSPPTRNTIGL